MGLATSSLSIELESDYGKTEDKPLPAGSILQGNVIVEIQRDIELPSPSHQEMRDAPALLQFRIYGKEKVCMDRGKAKINHDRKQKKNRWHRPQKSAERQIMNHFVRWTNFPDVEGIATKEGVVLSGVYVFPFSVDLPTMLPSSTYYPLEAVQSISKRGFRVQYKMDAQLTYGGHTAARKSSYLWLCASSGSAKTRRIPTPCMVEPISHEVNGLLQKGNIYFGAAVDDCAIRKGEDIILRVSCRNDSRATIERVQVNLYEKLTWGTTATNHVDPKTGVCSQTATLQQQTTIPLFTLKNASLPSLGKEAKGIFKSAYDSILGVEQKRMFQREIHSDLITGNNIIKIQVPEESRISYTGQLVKIEHMIQIRFFTSAFVKNLQLDIPVNVLPSDAPIKTEVLPQQPYCKSCAKPLAAPITATTGLEPYTNSPTDKPQGCQDLRSDSSGQTSGEDSSVPIPISHPLSPATPITSDVSVIGGDAVLVSNRRYPPALTPSAPPSYFDTPLHPPAKVTVAALQREMRSAINSYNVIAGKITQPEWTDFFQDLSAADMGKIIASVDNPVDQPRIAVLLAPLLNNGRGISSGQVAAALQTCNIQYRATMAQRLLPLCTDSNLSIIRAALNDWEQTVAHNAFGEAENRLNRKTTFLGGGKTKVAIPS